MQLVQELNKIAKEKGTGVAPKVPPAPLLLPFSPRLASPLLHSTLLCDRLRTQASVSKRKLSPHAVSPTRNEILSGGCGR